jgi:hypothetical protein
LPKNQTKRRIKVFRNSKIKFMFKNLRTWNLSMGLLHFVQGLIMFFLSKEIPKQIYFNLPTVDAKTRSFGLSAEKFIQINLGPTIAWFLFFSAIAHFLTASPKIYEWYQANLAKNMNLIRWWEYALSSSVMVVVIAILCGVTDASILILLFSINACMNLFGSVMEKHNSVLKENYQLKLQLKGHKDDHNIYESGYKTDWSAFIYGVFAGIIPWVIMGVYFFTAISRVSDNVKIPDFVYWIFPTLFVFFNLFAINMFFQYRAKGKWKDYLFGEKVYIILSLAAKTTLAWLIWGGTLR